MTSFTDLTEARIREAMERGDLDDLPGQGEPQVLEDDSMVPEALRPAYRMLKNAGYVPREVEQRGEIRRLEDLLDQVSTAEETKPAITQARRRLTALRSSVAGHRGESRPLWADETYEARLRARLHRDD